jgi:hypothetical protein
MKSFPSAFNIPQSDMVASNFNNNVIDYSIESDATNFVKNLGILVKDNKYNYSDVLNYSTISQSNKFVLLNREVNVSNIGTSDPESNATYKTNNKVFYENAFKIPAVILNAVNRYQYMFKESAVDIEEVSYNSKTIRHDVGVAQSLFNPWFGVRVQGVTLGVPLNQPINVETNDPTSSYYFGTYISGGNAYITAVNPDLEKKEKGKGKIALAYSSDDILQQIKVNLTANHNPDMTDCSIQTLVNLSGGFGAEPGTEPMTFGKNSLGRAKYRWADFMYCKDLGKVSNNHLITLRKFNAPIGDNINKWGKGNSQAPDVGRLISWFGTDDNKLEDICKYNYKASWKKLESEIQRIKSKEDNTQGKALPSLINLANPQYLKAVKHGIAGANNTFLSWLGEKSGIMSADGGYQNDSDYYHRDKNKVYEPKNTIRDTHIYEGALTFNQDITLNFSYKMRAYDGINQKAAFLDLLGNILEVTYKRGKFWGGSISFEGAPRNDAGWKKANQMIDDLVGGVKKVGTQLFSMPMEDWGQIFNGTNLMNAFGSLGEELGDLANSAKEVVGDALKGDFGGVKKALTSNNAKAIGEAMLGMMKNKLGRPQVYAMESLLSGAPVGLWHLTVGNPRNPIMTIGNLILENAVVQHSGPLGIDDFPTEIKVTVTLKHAKSRDITDISKMYTGGMGDIYHGFNGKEFKKYFSDVWTNGAVDHKIKYDYSGVEPGFDDGTSIKTNPAFSSINNPRGEVLQTREKERGRTYPKPIGEIINNGEPSPHKGNFGWNQDESIEKLQLNFVLRNLSK